MRTLSPATAIFIVLLALIPLLLAACPGPGPGPGGGAPVADYGDAPDGEPTNYPPGFAQVGAFPSFFASDGARTLSADDVMIGNTCSLEVDCDDALDPDGRPNLGPANADTDDGAVGLVLVLISIPPPAILEVEVSAPPTGGGRCYMNVLVDLDMDGSWGGTTGAGHPEWVVVNQAIQLTPGNTANVSPPAFAFGNGNRLPDGAWMRMALTTEQIAVNDWDGTGEFASGEVEDYIVDIPLINDKAVPIPHPWTDKKVYNVGDTVTLFCDNGSLTAGGNCRGRVLRTSGAVTLNGQTDIQVGPFFLAAGAAGQVVNAWGSGGNTPPDSDWVYRVWAIDPPSFVTDTLISVGYGDSYDFFTFSAADDTGCCVGVAHCPLCGVLAGVEVQIGSELTYTDDGGVYYLSGIPEGTHDVVASGYGHVYTGEVTVTAGESTLNNLFLIEEP